MSVTSFEDEPRRTCPNFLTSLRRVWLEGSYLKLGTLCLLMWVILPGFVPGQAAEQQIEESFQDGQKALKQGDYDRAVEAFKRVLALDPTLIEAEVNLGLAYQSLSQYDLAVSHLAKALRERPNLVPINVIVGMDYLKLNSPGKAIPFLEHALKLDPSNRDARDSLSSAYLRQEKYQAAAEELRQIALLDSDKPGAWYTLGHEYLDLAARVAYRGARLYQDSAWGHRFLGDLLFQRSRWDDAAQEFNKALAIEPKQHGLHTSLGEVYLRAGKLEEAEKQFHFELQLDSRTETAWLGLASLALLRSQPLAALESVEKAWQASPEFLNQRPEFPSIELTRDQGSASISGVLEQPEGPAKHFFLAGLYALNDAAVSDREWKSFQSDFSHWQKASKALPRTQTSQDPCKAHLYSRCVTSLQNAKNLDAASRLLLGKTYFDLQQFERAAALLALVRGDSKQEAQASYWLERTYQALGAQAYAQLEDSFPNHWRTHQLRAEGYALRGDHDNAVKEYQAALELRPGEAELHETLGEFYLDNHDDEDAIAELEKALSIDPSRTHSLYLIGRVCVQEHENEKAVPYLERALHLEPNLAEASGYLGTAYVHLGQFQKAVPRLEEAAPLDHYGNVHYQLYLAYRKLGKSELAEKALARSQELRQSSLERDQALILGASQESEPQ
jgi:tetratricopeptide (TPR) repeat protein